MKRPHGGASDSSLLDFSQDVNFLGPPASVLQALRRGIQAWLAEQKKPEIL